MEVLLDIICQKKNRIIIFANYNATFHKIKQTLDDNNITSAKLETNTQDTIEKFSNNQISVLMVHAKQFGAGLNLQMTQTIIIYHRFTKEIEEQVIGRGQRIGRTEPLDVFYLIHENEKTPMKNDDFQDIDYYQWLDDHLLEEKEENEEIIQKKLDIIKI